MANFVAFKAGKPYGPDINRPTVEYTGKGNLLCYLGFSGRIFRSSEKAVREACEELIRMYKEDESAVNCSDLYNLLGIETTDFGDMNGWSPDDDYKVDLSFIFTMCCKGTGLYEKFGEPVFLIELDLESQPMQGYWEI